MTSRRAAILLVLFFTIFAPARAADVTGRWEGSIELPGGKLEVDVDLRSEEGGFGGDITIPQQGAKDLPLESVTVTGDEVTFAISGVPGSPTFRGSVSADGSSLSGTFSQGGATFPFTLARGDDPVAKARAALAGIGESIRAALEDWKTPGLSLAVVADRKTILAEGYGLRDMEGKKPVTGKTLFAIGSSTKAFTAAVLGTLVDEGKLRWDEPVATYLPEFRMHDEHASFHLTPRDLVTHRSGLPRHDLVWYGDESTTRADLVRRLRYLEPNKDLREIWQYNNLMFLTAGHLTETLTGGTWEEAVRARILDPAEMSRTNFDVAASQSDPDHALPYREKDDAIRRIPFRPITVMGPAGSINSSAEDLVRWMRVQLEGGTVDGKTVLEAGTVRELQTPQMVIPGFPEEPYLSPASYAMGWITGSWRGTWRVQHGGNIDGFSALVTLYPREGVGIAVLVNKNGSPLPHLVTATVADRVLGLEPKDWLGEAAAKRDAAKGFAKAGEKDKARFRVEGTKPTHPLPAYAGEYADPGYGTLEVVSEKGGLVLVYHGMRMPLVHWHYDTFNVEANGDEMIPENLRVSFLTDREGRISRLSTPLEPTVESIVFERLPDKRLRDPAFLARLAGSYEIPNQVLTIEVRGDRLVLRVPGQPDYDLEPSGPDEFRLTIVEGYRVRFTVPATGPATDLLLIQPNGVFPAKRK